MGLSETYINILNHPTVDATINFIKKFKSSKSYWSVSSLILLFTMREAIAWKFGSTIKIFCETQAVDSSFPTFWEVLGFVLDVGGSWELVALGTFVFVLLSLVKVAESEGTSISVRENYLTLFLLVFVGSVSFYQNDEVKTIVEENSKVLKKIEQDKNVTNYLVDELRLQKDIVYALLKSVEEIAPENKDEIISRAKREIKENGYKSAIFYLKLQLSALKKQEKISLVVNEEKTSKVGDGDKYQQQVEVIETNKTLDDIMIFIDNTVEIDGLIYENIPFTRRYTWDEANDYCSEKNDMAKEWRLPIRTELHKLSNIKMYGESDSGWREWFNTNKGKRLKASNGRELFVREEFLENMSEGYYFWTNEDHEYSSSAWLVNFRNGHDHWGNKTRTNYVLCVSGQ